MTDETVTRLCRIADGVAQYPHRIVVAFGQERVYVLVNKGDTPRTVASNVAAALQAYLVRNPAPAKVERR